MAAGMHKMRLGRSLASLIGEGEGAEFGDVEGQRNVALDALRAGRFNPRRNFSEAQIEELAVSIRERGLVQPLIVRPKGGTGPGYEIVAGERRWRAAQRAGLHTLPVIVRELGDKEVLELAIIENVQRADLNAIEEARGYRELTERYSYSQDDLSQIIGKSRSHLANTMRLLKLPDTVQGYVLDGQLTAGHARALVGREDAEALARRVIDRGMTVRDIEALVQMPVGEGDPTRKVREKDPDTLAFEKEVSEAIGLKTEIKKGSGEAGVLKIRYRNYDQLEYIKQRLISGQ